MDWMAYKQQNSFLTVLGMGRSMIKVLADPVSGESLVLGCRWSISMERMLASSLASSYKDAHSIHEGSTLVI